MARTSNSKEAILEQALGLMSRKGYTNTAMDELALAAGVKKGSLYHFFPSKQALALEVMEFYWGRSEVAFRQALADLSDSPIERVLLFCSGHTLQQVDGHFCGCLFGNIIAEMSLVDCTLSKKAYEILNRLVGLLKEHLDEAVRVGEIGGEVDTKLLARQMLAYFEGCILMAKGCQHVESVRELAGGLATIVGSHRTKQTTCGG